MDEPDAVSLLDRRPALDLTRGLRGEEPALQAPQLVVAGEHHRARGAHRCDGLRVRFGRGADHRVDDVAQTPQLLRTTCACLLGEPHEALGVPVHIRADPDDHDAHPRARAWCLGPRSVTGGVRGRQADTQR